MIKAKVYCINVFDGTHDTPKPVNEGYKLLTSKNILNGVLDTENAYYISRQDYEEINRRSKVQKWDILFSMIGTVGNVCLVTNDVVNFAIKNMGVFSCQDEAKAKWMYYYLQSPYVKKQIDFFLNGAVQKFLPLSWLRDFELPDLSTKRSNITNLLWDLDSKIKNNAQICTELEAMAKTTYDYWFVQFDFPDENGKPYRTSGGEMVWNDQLKREIPKGWKVSNLKDICDIGLGGTPDTKDSSLWGGDIPWLNSGEVAVSPVLKSEKTITQKGMDSSSTAFASAGAVVMSITRYIRPSILAIDACFNQSVVAVCPNATYHTAFLYPFMLSQVNRYMTVRSGAQQPHINKEVVENTLLPLPKASILEEYYKIVEPVYRLQVKTAKQTGELTKLRDWLLPMLMNGQATVE